MSKPSARGTAELRATLRVVAAVLVASLAWGCTALRSLKPVPLPLGVKEVRDLAYRHGPSFDEHKHRLDLYLPKGPGPHVVIVFVHGGYWVAGDRRGDFGTYQRLGRRLAARGVLTVIPSYRLSPEHKHPAHIEDLAHVVRTTLANVAHYGGDPSQVFVMGHSAGAHLVSLLGADPRWLFGVGRTPASLAGVIGLSGPYDILFLAENAQSQTERVFGPDKEVWRDASPQAHLMPSRPHPPFFLAVGKDEPAGLIAQHHKLVKALDLAGGGSQAEEVPDRNHFTMITQLGEADDPLVELILRFVRRVQNASQAADSLHSKVSG